MTLAWMLGAGSAFAQTYGTKGTVSFSIDRAFGFSHTNVNEEFDQPGRPEEDTSVTHFGFGWQGPVQVSPFIVPRIGFDYFVIDGLSVGGSIAYASIDGNHEPSDTNFDGSAFLFSPRVGYVWMFSDVVGFWLRGGFTYHAYTSDFQFFLSTDEDENGFALTVEPIFVFAPVDHFGFWAGPTADFSITGTRDRPGPGPNDSDVRYRTLGIHVGLIGYL